MNDRQPPEAERGTGPDHDSRQKPVIVYTVSGQGRGHAAKSVAVYEELIETYDVRFLAGGEAYDFFIRKGLPVIEIPALRFAHRNSAIYLPGTLAINMPHFRRWRSIMRDIKEKLTQLNPVLVISDFEFFVPRAARKLGIPVLQISHQVVLVTCRYKVPFGQWYSYLKAYWTSKIIIGRYDHAIGVSFFPAALKRGSKRKVEIMPPAFRPELLDYREEDNPRKHILTYYSCTQFAWVTDKLAAYPEERFIVYGPDPDKQPVYPNVTYKEISPKTFLEDLLTAKAVITNGGHNFISEAFFLGVPIMSFWVKGQFEQFLNAWFVEDMKLGRMVRKFNETEQVLANFMDDLSKATGGEPKTLKSGNNTIATRINAIQESLSAS